MDITLLLRHTGRVPEIRGLLAGVYSDYSWDLSKCEIRQVMVMFCANYEAKVCNLMCGGWFHLAFSDLNQGEGDFLKSCISKFVKMALAPCLARPWATGYCKTLGGCLIRREIPSTLCPEPCVVCDCGGGTNLSEPKGRTYQSQLREADAVGGLSVSANVSKKITLGATPFATDKRFGASAPRIAAGSSEQMPPPMDQ